MSTLMIERRATTYLSCKKVSCQQTTFDQVFHWYQAISKTSIEINYPNHTQAVERRVKLPT